MGKAIEYTYALLPRLSRYVNDGRIEIDDNRIENAISPFGVLSSTIGMKLRYFTLEGKVCQRIFLTTGRPVYRLWFKIRCSLY